MVQAHEQMVRECAYYLWIKSGRMDGMAHEHWIAAERTVACEAPSFDAPPGTGETATKKKAASKAAKPAQKATKAATEPTKAAKSKSAAMLVSKVGAKSAGRTAAKGQAPSHGAMTH